VSDWRPAVLAAAIVLAGGGLVGSLTADSPTIRTRTVVRFVPTTPAITRTTTQPAAGPQAEQPPAPPVTQTTPPERAEPTDPSDTLAELVRGESVNNPSAYYGTVRLGGKSYYGTSVSVGYGGDNDTRIEVNNRYKRVTGLVGIADDAECPTNEASVSIVDTQSGQDLWGPKRVNIDSPIPFSVKIAGLRNIELVPLSVAESGAGCDNAANVAWGNVEFMK